LFVSSVIAGSGGVVTRAQVRSVVLPSIGVRIHLGASDIAVFAVHCDRDEIATDVVWVL